MKECALQMIKKYGIVMTLLGCMALGFDIYAMEAGARGKQDNQACAAQSDGDEEQLTAAEQKAINDTAFLSLALQSGYVDRVQMALAEGEVIDGQNKFGWTALMLVQDIDAVQELLYAKASVDMQNSNGDTALHLAMMQEHSEKVAILVFAGARFDIKNKDNQTAVGLIASETGTRDHAAVCFGAGEMEKNGQITVCVVDQEMQCDQVAAGCGESEIANRDQAVVGLASREMQRLVEQVEQEKKRCPDLLRLLADDEDIASLIPRVVVELVAEYVMAPFCQQDRHRRMREIKFSER